MSLFRLGASTRERRATDTLIAHLEALRGSRSRAGEIVSDVTAMQHHAVWGCVDLISELVSTLPVDEYRKVDGAPKAQNSMFLADPAGDGSGFEVWCRQVMTSLLLRGNAFGFITSLGPDGWPRTVDVLHPDRIDVRRTLTWGPADWFLDNKPIDRWPAGPLWHLPAYCAPGSPVGMSPIRYAAETIGLGIATRKFGAEWFADGAHPTHTLESDQQIDDTLATAIKQRVKDTLYENREPLVLGAGLKMNQVQVAPNESQFLETIKATADDIARFFFRRPPGEGGQVTYANVEARSLDLLTYTLTGWLVRIENSLTRLRPKPRYVKFNADALVRVDLLNRYKAHDLAIRGGFANPDERRALEDLPPIPDGKGQQFLWPPGATSQDQEQGEATPRELAEMVQKIYLGVGVLITEDEAREILNRAGANLPVGPGSPSFTDDQGGDGAQGPSKSS